MANTIGPKLPSLIPSTRTVAAAADAVSSAVSDAAQAVTGADLGSTFDAVSTGADWVETAADGLARTNVARVAGKLSQTAAVKAATLGEKLEKLAPKVQNIGTAATALSAMVQSDASSRTGKVLNGVTAGAATKLAAQALSTPVAVADMVLNLAGDKLLGAKANKAAGGYITGHAISTPANLATAYFEAARGDTRALETFSAKAKAGEYGAIYQAALNAGDYWAEHGVVGGLKEARQLVSAEGARSLVGFAKDRLQAARDFFKSP